MKSQHFLFLFFVITATNSVLLCSATAEDDELPPRAPQLRRTNSIGPRAIFLSSAHKNFGLSAAQKSQNEKNCIETAQAPSHKNYPIKN